MLGSILSVHIIDGRDIKTANGRNSANSQLKLSIENQSSKTQIIQGTNDPVWDEVIIFDIKTATEKLKVQLFDV